MRGKDAAQNTAAPRARPTRSTAPSVQEVAACFVVSAAWIASGSDHASKDSPVRRRASLRAAVTPESDFGSICGFVTGGRAALAAAEFPDCAPGSRIWALARPASDARSAAPKSQPEILRFMSLDNPFHVPGPLRYCFPGGPQPRFAEDAAKSSGLCADSGGRDAFAQGR